MSESFEKFNSKETESGKFPIDWDKYANDRNYSDKYRESIESKCEESEGVTTSASPGKERIQNVIENGDFDVEFWDNELDFSSYPESVKKTIKTIIDITNPKTKINMEDNHKECLAALTCFAA